MSCRVFGFCMNMNEIVATLYSLFVVVSAHCSVLCFLIHLGGDKAEKGGRFEVGKVGK